jgi:hypothetical protein
VERQTRAVSPRDRQQRQCERDLVLFGQILFSHAHPTAAGGKRRPHHIGERHPCLTSVGDEQQRRIGQRHGCVPDRR